MFILLPVFGSAFYRKLYHLVHRIDLIANIVSVVAITTEPSVFLDCSIVFYTGIIISRLLKIPAFLCFEFTNLVHLACFTPTPAKTVLTYITQVLTLGATP